MLEPQIGLHRLALDEEDRVEHVDGARPPLRLGREHRLDADGEVELGLERVQQQVYLVHDEARGAKEREHLRQAAHVVLHRRVLLAPRVAQHVHLLKQLELDRLDRRRRAPQSSPT